MEGIGHLVGLCKYANILNGKVEGEKKGKTGKKKKRAKRKKRRARREAKAKSVAKEGSKSERRYRKMWMEGGVIQSLAAE